MFKSIAKSFYLNSKKNFFHLINSSKQNFKFIKFNSKFVSNNPQSKVNRENRELDKIERFWEKVEQDEIRRRNLESEVEKKYSDLKIDLGKDLKDEKGSSKNTIQSYYVPLTNEDLKLLEHFSNEAAEMIKTGGRLVLLNELNFYNKSQPLEKQIKLSDPSFEPLSLKEVEEFKKDFNEIFENEEIFNFVLQKGKSLYKDLKNLKEEILKNYQIYTQKLDYLDDYSEAMTSIPFNSKITVNFEKQEDPYYVKLLLDKVKFNEVETTNKFKEIYFNYYKAIVDSYKERKDLRNNPEAQEKSGLNQMEEQIEFNLLKRTSAFVDYLINHGMKVDFVKDISKTDIEEKSYIFEKLFIKGVSIDRSENYEPDEYVLIDSHENLGIRYFLHKALIGEGVKLDQDFKPTMASSKITDSDYINSVNFKVTQKNRKIVLRAYLLIKHPFRFVTDKLEYPTEYSYTHLAVFENEIEPPHHINLIEMNFEKYLKNHKLNLNDWRLVDVDNFMRGNPFFIPKSPVLSCHETYINIDNQIQDYIKQSFGITEFKTESKKTAQNEVKSNETTKKDKKKKEKKEENKDQELSAKDIPELKFNYKITKFNRQIKKYLIGTLEENEEIMKEIEKHNNKQIALNENKLKENFARLEEFDKGLDEDLNSVEKLESVVTLNKKLKKEIKKVEFEKINLNVLDSNKDIELQKNKLPTSNLDKLINELLVKHVNNRLNGKDEGLY